MKFHLHPTARPALLGPFAFLLGIFALSRGIPMATMCFGKMNALAFREVAVGYLKDEICNQVLQISEGAAWHILGGYWYILVHDTFCVVRCILPLTVDVVSITTMKLLRALWRYFNLPSL